MLNKTESLLTDYEKRLKKNPEFTHWQHSIAVGLPYRAYMARINEAAMLKKKQPEFSLGTPLTVYGDALVISDTHVPFLDLEYFSLALQVAKKHLPEGNRNLIIDGDLTNQDSWSKYPKLLKDVPNEKQERDATRALLWECLQVFDAVTWVVGNHDRRLQKAMNGTLDSTDLLSIVATNKAGEDYMPAHKVKITDFGHCILDCDAPIKWRVTHPAGYGINQLTYASDLALKFQQNIISAHEHHLSIGWDRFDRYVIVNCGCMVDPGKLAYAKLDDDKKPEMKQGFVMVRNNTPYLFGREPFTDWTLWL